ncbi:hypothetical protein [Leeia sp.]|uniref:hypothetical protein n=1 Tax=Leeia sp. TaxID=2884678 RepID=UPI0035B022A7
MLRYSLLAGVLLVLSACRTDALLHADARLRSQLRQDGVYRALQPKGDWMQCVLIEENVRTSAYVDLETREIHQAPCPGDPGSIPLLDAFRVGAEGNILWYDPLAEHYRPYAEFLVKQRTAAEPVTSGAERALP